VRSPSLNGLARHDVLLFVVSLAAMTTAYVRASCTSSNRAAAWTIRGCSSTLRTM
jgi:hypothetical protein